MRKQFNFKGDTFAAEFLEEKSSYKVWQKIGSDGLLEEKFFLTTAMPSPDQLVIFHKLGREFIFFDCVLENSGVLEVMIDGLVSHYTYSLPYVTNAYVVPYKLEGMPGNNTGLVVEFVQAVKFHNMWNIRLIPNGPWIRTAVEVLN